MLSRYYNTVRTPAFDIFDTFKLLNEFDSLDQRHDSIDEEGIKIELPGVKPSDVDVTVDGKTLKVTGKSRHGKEFSYVYNLKSTVDIDTVSAKLQDGLLDIKLPKKVPESSVKKISVQS
jgi:HSP20 family molecular chaperone IbpA